MSDNTKDCWHHAANKLEMDFYKLIDQVAKLLQQRARLTYRSLRREFDLDDVALEDFKDELFFSQPVVDEAGQGSLTRERVKRRVPIPLRWSLGAACTYLLGNAKRFR